MMRISILWTTLPELQTAHLARLGPLMPTREPKCDGVIEIAFIARSLYLKNAMKDLDHLIA